MSNIVEPYITKTESTSLFDKFNNLPAKIQPIKLLPNQETSKEQKGKYKFIKDYTTGLCIEYNSTGVNPCSKYKYINYKAGDVINVETFLYNEKNTLAKFTVEGQILSVPISLLQKVSDSTEIQISNDSSTPKDNKKLINIALLLVGGYIVYRLFKK
jgi:hypothetical protein